MLKFVNQYLDSLNERTYLRIFVGVIVLLYISVCVETDMYVPAFPQMVRDLGTTEDLIQGVLSINFLGLCFSSLWVGPIADSFGRRKTILIGMLIFSIASLGCTLSNTLPQMLMWRFFQGMGAGVPMTVGFAIFLDRFDAKTCAALIGVMNTVITMAIAGAPIVGSWVSFNFHWRMNFVVISALGILALASFYLLIPETLPPEKRLPFRPKAIMNDYGKALLNPEFVGHVLIVTAMLGGIIAFVSNQSLIFLNYLKVSPTVYGFYQASSMTSCAVGSILSGAWIRRFGVIGAKRLSVGLAAAGGISFVLVAVFTPENAFLICLCSVLIALGTGMGIGSLAASAMEVFPHMKATASGLMGALRLMLTASMVGLSAMYFNGTVLPIALLIGGAQMMGLLIYLALEFFGVTAKTADTTAPSFH